MNFIEAVEHLRKEPKSIVALPNCAIAMAVDPVFRAGDEMVYRLISCIVQKRGPDNESFNVLMKPVPEDFPLITSLIFRDDWFVESITRE